MLSCLMVWQVLNLISVWISMRACVCCSLWERVRNESSSMTWWKIMLQSRYVNICVTLFLCVCVCVHLNSTQRLALTQMQLLSFCFEKEHVHPKYETSIVVYFPSSRWKVRWSFLVHKTGLSILGNNWRSLWLEKRREMTPYSFSEVCLHT